MARGSASKIARWRRCRHSAWYSDIMKIERDIQSVAPVRGNILHACLQEHYSGRDWAKPIVDLKIDLEHIFEEERADWAELPKELYRIMRGYLLAYKGLDAGIKTIATEVPFEIPIGTLHTYSGYIDWIYEDDAGVWICDHKTVKTLPKESDLYMDLQTLMYYEAARLDDNVKKLIGDRRLAGIVFNHLRTKAPREPALLKNGGISKAACDTDIATYFDAVKKAGLDTKDYADMLDKLKGNVFFKRTKVPVSEVSLAIIKDEIQVTLDEISFYTAKAEDFGEDAKRLFVRTPLKQRCDWDCSYKDLCFAELAGMNTQELLAERYKEKESREESTDGE